MSKNYLELKISDLREECKQRNLETSGLKVHLVERLKKFDKDIQTLETKNNCDKIVIEAEKQDLEPQSDVNDKILIVEDIKVKPLPSIEQKKLQSAPVKIVNKVKLLERALLEPKDWECRTDVHLDFYNSDLYLVIDPMGYSAEPISDNGFEYLFAGVKGNYGLKMGRVFFEVKITKKINVNLVSDAGDSNCIKIGWSSDYSSLALGEEELSFGFDGIGKKLTNNLILDYGISVKENDVIGCFLEFKDDCFIIHFSVNGVNQGEAFSGNCEDLKDQILLPHIYVRNMNFEVNFGQDQEAFFEPKTVDNTDDFNWTQFGKVDIDNRIRALCPPKSKSDCEVLMMCGLPSCGKTTWVDKMVKENPEKFYNVLSTNVILDKMKVTSLRKKCAGSRWETFIQSATQCLSKMMEIAVTRRRNFVLDQTNVYPTAQRRRMKTFEEFIRKAIIIVPTDDEYQRRMNQVITEEGKDVPESAVLQMKENFAIPDETSDLFTEIMFVELQRPDAEEVVKKYNDEAKAKKKADEHSNSSCKRSERVESSSSVGGDRGSSPKKSEADTSSQSTAKKSRWNEERSEESSKYSKSSSRDYGNTKSSSSSSSRKNEYKGGFCFAREADDTDKGASGRGVKQERDRSRGKEPSREDRYGSSRSSGGGDSQQSKRPNARPDRMHDSNSRFNQSDDRRGDRSRDRVNDNRRPTSYDARDTRGPRYQAPQSQQANKPGYNDFRDQEPPRGERASRFQDKTPNAGAGSFAATKFNYGGANAAARGPPGNRQQTQSQQYYQQQQQGYQDEYTDQNYGGNVRGGIGMPVNSNRGGLLGWNGAPQTDAAFGQNPSSQSQFNDNRYGKAPIPQSNQYGAGKAGGHYGNYQSYDDENGDEEEDYSDQYSAPTGGVPFKVPLTAQSSKAPFKPSVAPTAFKQPASGGANYYGGNKQTAAPYEQAYKMPGQSAKAGAVSNDSGYGGYNTGRSASVSTAPPVNKPTSSYNAYNTADSYGADNSGGYNTPGRVGAPLAAAANKPAADNYGFDGGAARMGGRGASSESYGGGYKSTAGAGYGSQADEGYKGYGGSGVDSYDSASTGGYNAAPGASAGGYNTAGGGNYNSATTAYGGSGSYKAASGGGSAYNSSSGGAGAYNSSSGGAGAYNSTPGGAGAYNSSSSGAGAYNTSSSAAGAYNSSSGGVSYNAPTGGTGGYNMSGGGSGEYNTSGGGYGAATGGGYGTGGGANYSSAASGAYGSGSYNTPSSTSGSAGGGASYGNKNPASGGGAYSGMYGDDGYGSYSDAGGYKTQPQAMATSGGGAPYNSSGLYNTSSSASNQKAPPAANKAASQTYTNPYSTCYDGNSGAVAGSVSTTGGGYDYGYGQGEAPDSSYGAKAATGLVGSAPPHSAAPPAATAAAAYGGDYSQYYQSYQGYGN